MDTSRLKKSTQTTDMEKLLKDYEDSTEKSLATIDWLTMTLAKKTEKEKELEKRITSDESHIKYLEGRIPSSESFSTLADGVDEIKDKLLKDSKIRDYCAVCLLFFLMLQTMPMLIKTIPLEVIACVINKDYSFFFPCLVGMVLPFLMLSAKRNRKTQMLLPYMIASILITYFQCFLSIYPWTSTIIGIIFFGILHCLVWLCIELIYRRKERNHD